MTDDYGNGNHDRVANKLAEIEADFKEMLSRLDPLVEKRLRELAGSHFDIMAQSYEETTKYLAHADPKLRYAAISLVCNDWRKARALSNTFETMALTDTTPEVRDGAIRAIGNCHARTKDQRIGRFLAKIVCDEQVDEGIRLTAFMSLVRVNGILDSGINHLVPLSLAEIDWKFVGKFGSDKRPGDCE